MIFTLLICLAVIHLLLKPVKSASLKNPAVLLEYLTSAAHIFGILVLIYAVGVFFKRFWAGYSDLLPLAMLLAAFAAGKGFRMPEPLIAMTYAAGMYLAMEPLKPALFHAMVVSLGVALVEWLADGMRFRLVFTPSVKYFSTLPGFLILLALIGLILSGFFTALS